MSEAYSKALDQLRDYGLLVDEIIADGRYHHVKVDGNKGGKKSGWYVCSEIRLKNDEIALVGAYGNYKLSDDRQIIKPDAVKLTQDEKRELEAKRKAVFDEAEAERAKLHERALRLAPKIWSFAREDRGSFYLGQKKVASFDIRVDRHGNTLVPVRNWNGILVGLQFIPPDGKGKKFLTGTQKQGAFHILGSLEGTAPLVFAEGYSTGASCHMATKWPVIVCFDAGNLDEVVRAARARFPKREFIVAGDDDHEAVDQFDKPDNKGRKKATAAAKAARAHLAFPVFRSKKGRTDFNDLHVADGLDRVAELLRLALETEPAEGDIPSGPTPTGDAGNFDFSLGMLLQRYTLIYGTLTIYDNIQRRIIGLSELRAAAGNKTVTRWQKHPERRIINPEDVVFDPSETCASHCVNLFKGMPLVPKAGPCNLILNHLYYLCDQNDAVHDWILKWIAYPLQHVGAKMQTCIIFHGPQGTGKNTLWNVVRTIYGRYGVIITQNELEAKYNGWASSKLFIIGNEIVPRRELYQLKGKLNNMITETEWMIEEKHLPTRPEANHANMVMLSNVLQPVTPDPDDRRYLIVWTPPPKPAAWYPELAKQIAEGGIEAFYHYLMKLDLGDFNAHTKPIATEAKSRLIEMSLDTPDRFWNQWSAGELKWSYLPAPTMAVYGAYKSWCEKRGERALREVVFCAQLHRRMLKLKKRLLDGPNRVQRWCFIPIDWRPEAGKAEEVALGECLNFFRGDADGDNYAP